MSLPKWPGASACYSRAYRLLERMAQNGHVRRSWFRGHDYCTTSQEMDDLIKALNKGDEETIKGVLLLHLGDDKWRTPTILAK